MATSYENVRLFIIALVEVIAVTALTIIAWMFSEFLSSEFSRIFVVLTLGVVILWPVRYRFEKEPEGRWIRIPFLLAGFCELAIVVFDRFKPSAKP